MVLFLKIVVHLFWANVMKTFQMASNFHRTLLRATMRQLKIEGEGNTNTNTEKKKKEPTFLQGSDLNDWQA